MESQSNPPNPNTTNPQNPNPNNPLHHHHHPHLQQLLLQQQQQHQRQQLLFLQQQQQQMQQRQQQQQQQQPPSSTSQPPPSNQQQYQFSLQQQQAISRFPSNIDAHLRPPGVRAMHFQSPPSSSSSQSQQQQQQQSGMQQQLLQQQQQAARMVGVGVGRTGNPIEVEMAQQDAMKVCNPDFKRPFSSIEDAVQRLLPYHVVSDYEAEEDDRILDSDTTGRGNSRLQQWDHNILAKIAEFTTTFEKQVLAFNIMSRKRALGEFRSEERLMIEQALMQEEKQSLLDLKTEIENREKAGREAAEAKMRMAMVQAEQARAAAQAQGEMIIRPPMRSNSAASHGDEGSGHDLGQDQNMDEIQGWGNAQRDDDEPSEDFLNDENEPENGETGMQDDWQESGALDLNSR